MKFFSSSSENFSFGVENEFSWLSTLMRFPVPSFIYPLLYGFQLVKNWGLILILLQLLGYPYTQKVLNKPSQEEEKDTKNTKESLPKTKE